MTTISTTGFVRTQLKMRIASLKKQINKKQKALATYERELATLGTKSKKRKG